MQRAAEKKVDSITSLLEQARAQFVFSGYQFHGEGPKGSLSLAGGTLTHWQDAPAVTAATYFDIGSVTKAVATTSLLALAVEQGAVGLDDSLFAHIRVLAPSPLGKVKIGNLLSHSAGLAAWLPVGLETKHQDLVTWLLREEGRVRPRPSGESAVYSDVGFLLLGLLIESIWGDWETAFRQRVALPLGLGEVGYQVNASSCAATEFSLVSRQLLQGEVFDDNSRQMGGRTAHAGLFATARGLAPWAREWLAAVAGKSSWLGKKTARLFTSRSHRAPDSSWGYGWDTRSNEGSSAGSRFSLSSFGHLGYPGCSVWIDPVGEHFAILHTNRVHPSRLDDRIRLLRPRVHDAWANFCRS